MPAAATHPRGWVEPLKGKYRMHQQATRISNKKVSTLKRDLTFVITYAELTHLKCPGMNQSEIEDMIVPEIDWPKLAEKFGLGAEIPRKIDAVDRKWSERIKYIFERAGKLWDEDIELECKTIVATAVEENSLIEECVRECRRDVVKSLISKLEEMACV